MSDIETKLESLAPNGLHWKCIMLEKIYRIDEFVQPSGHLVSRISLDRKITMNHVYQERVLV